MTLPTVLQKAMRIKHRDPSMRYTYPIESWKLEQGEDASTFIMTFTTDDGFSVAFSLPRTICEELAVNLSGTSKVGLAPVRH